MTIGDIFKAMVMGAAAATGFFAVKAVKDAWVAGGDSANVSCEEDSVRGKS